MYDVLKLSLRFNILNYEKKRLNSDDQPLQAKRTTTSHLKSLNTKMTKSCDIRNPGLGVGQAHMYDVIENHN